MDPRTSLRAWQSSYLRGEGLSGMGSFVAGDIVVTRWMWKRCIDMNVHARTLFLSVFFGVMLTGGSNASSDIDQRA